MSDIEIARRARAQPIADIARKLDIPDSALIPYGRSKAKIDPQHIAALVDQPDGKLIPVSYTHLRAHET